jgi:hypothetical protein
MEASMKKPNLEDIRAGAMSYAKQITAKCEAEGIKCGVIVAIVPLADPRPQWASNLPLERVVRVLESLQQDAALQSMVVAPGGKA